MSSLPPTNEVSSTKPRGLASSCFIPKIKDLASDLDKEVEFKIGGVFVSHEFIDAEEDGADTDTDVENEEDHRVASPKPIATLSSNSAMMYSQQDIEVKTSREQNKAKRKWRRKKQSYLAQMSLMQQKIDKLEQKKAEFDIKNKEVDGIICEFEKTAEAVAQEKESEIYELVQQRQKLQTKTDNLKLKNTAVTDKVQAGREHIGVLDSQHHERLVDLQCTQQHATQKVQFDMVKHQKVIDTAAERAKQHQRNLEEVMKTKENLQRGKTESQANLDSVRQELKQALATVKSQRNGAQKALLELRQNAMSTLKEHKALTKEMSALRTSKPDWLLKQHAISQQNTEVLKNLEADKQKLEALVAAKKTAVLEAYRWGEDKDKQITRLKNERAKTSELVDIRNELEQQKLLSA